MRKFLMVGAGVVALGASGLAVAAPGMMGKIGDADGNVTRAQAIAASDAMFQKMDANQDGRIDEADREAKKRERFDAIDADNDGQITQAEMEAHRASERAARQARMAERSPERAAARAGNEAQADRAERDARRAERSTDRFAAMDSDSSGALSFAEFSQPHKSMRGPRAGGGEKARGGEGADRSERKRGGKWGGRGHHGGKMMLKMVDTDNDGAVTAAEMRAAALARFDKADADKDGIVTKAERDAARDQMRAEWQQRRSSAE